MKITDVTVKRYSASREPRTDAAGIQIVEVHTDAGVHRSIIHLGTARALARSRRLARNPDKACHELCRQVQCSRSPWSAPRRELGPRG